VCPSLMYKYKVEYIDIRLGFHKFISSSHCNLCFFLHFTFLLFDFFFPFLAPHEFVLSEKLVHQTT
jgi:hypothetical protein